MTTLDRQRVVAHRAQVHGLHGGRGGHGLDAVGVLALGLQDAPSGSADLGFAIRTADPRPGRIQPWCGC